MTETMPDGAAPGLAVSSPRPTTALWEGDSGTLREPSRRAFAALVKGPYVSAERHGDLWRALVSDTEEIRSRLADMFLELVVDTALGVAFIRGAELAEGTAPQVVRTLPLTFIDTILLLHLRGELVRSGGAGRVIVGKDEVYEQLGVYQAAASTDQAGFTKRINASWTKLEKQNILAKTSTEGRFEVSPVLRLVFGAEEIAAVSAEYKRLLTGGGEGLHGAADAADIEAEADIAADAADESNEDDA